MLCLSCDYFMTFAMRLCWFTRLVLVLVVVSDVVVGLLTTTQHTEDEIFHLGSGRSLGNPYGYVSDWTGEHGGLMGSRLGQQASRCVDIPSNMTLCRDIGYHQMRLPNLLDHESVKEATQQAGSWVPLVNIHCHPDTQIFLCSLFAPVCLDRPIYPCRKLCEAVQKGCEDRMIKYGFPWPEMLRCEKFAADNDLCIGIRNDSRQEDPSCQACSQPEIFENIVDHFCSAEFVLKIKLEQSTISGSDLKLTTSKKKKIFKKGNLKAKDLQMESIWYIEKGSKCKCNGIDTSAPRMKGAQFLAMGRRGANGRMLLGFVQPYDSRSSIQAGALMAAKKEKICKSGFKRMSSDDGLKTMTIIEKRVGSEKSGSEKTGSKKRDNAGGRKQLVKDKLPKNQSQSRSNQGQSRSNQGQSRSIQGKPDTIRYQFGSSQGQSGSNQGQQRSNQGQLESNKGQSGLNQGQSGSKHDQSGLIQGRSKSKEENNFKTMRGEPKPKDRSKKSNKNMASSWSKFNTSIAPANGKSVINVAPV